MGLTTQQRIELDHLLLQREAAYVRVHRAEAGIQRIFGGDFPLPPPPVEVASARRGAKRTQSTTRKSGPRIAPKLRPLGENESAYRVAFRQEGTVVEEIHTDRKAIQDLLKSSLADSLVLRVETIDQDGNPAEQIFS